MKLVFDKNCTINADNVKIAIEKIKHLFPEYAKSLVESTDELLISTSSNFSLKKHFLPRADGLAHGLQGFTVTVSEALDGMMQIPVLTVVLGSWLSEEYPQKVLDHELVHIAQKLLGYSHIYYREGVIIRTWKGEELPSEYREYIEMEQSMPFEIEANKISPLYQQDYDTMAVLFKEYINKCSDETILQPPIRDFVNFEEFFWKDVKIEGYSIKLKECYEKHYG